MKILWYALWVLLALHLIAIPFWAMLVRKIARISFTRKRWNILSGIVLYGIILGALLVPFIFLSLNIGKQSMIAKMKPPNSTASADEYGMVDIRGQIHVHCYLSHDSKGTLEELSQAAKKDGVRWIILTDHHRKLPPGNYPDYVNGVLFIYGSERNAPEGGSQFWASLKDPKSVLHLHGHLENFCRLDDEKKWELLNGEQFALWNGAVWEPLDGMELVNFHANAFKNAGKILKSVFVGPDDLYDGLLQPLPALTDYWQALAEKTGRPIPIFAAPDAHQNIRILGIQMDPYELILGLVSTHIWIEKSKELNQESIFEAIKKGRTYIAFDYLGDPTGFQFYADNAVAGVKTPSTHFTGETVKNMERLLIRLPDSLLVNNSGWDGSGLELKFYRDNRLASRIYETPVFLKTTPPGIWLLEPGCWRVEVWKNERPWIISGQILIK